MDLDARTLHALDWRAVRDALAEGARTPRGAAACQALAPLSGPDAVAHAHDAIDEIRAVWEAGQDLPIGDVSDVEALARRASKGEVLDLSELRAVGNTLVALQFLAHAVAAWEHDTPVLRGHAGLIALDGDLVATLEEAFDGQGELSAELWPVLGELRKRIAELHGSIRTTLDGLLAREDLADVLQDQYVTQRQDRYVLPVKSRAKRWDLGIVHGTSGSGQTVFIEPNEVVQLNNLLRVAEGELDAEEARIRARLSSWIGQESEPVADGLRAATALDVHCARAHLAQRLRAGRPRVARDGVVALQGARHPVLQLRGVSVVPNDLRLDAERPALVLSGPNAGGKTVALKTVGLSALLVRHGCFVPAEPGSRVDWFSAVYADVGDPQSIQGDLSSFSGHLVALRETLGRAGPGVLVLLDEIATGTDPGQGAALARAVLEALLDRGVRLVVTTHYAQLKGLATADPRFGVAAMEYAEAMPTYRVVPGSPGESHAFGIAERLGLDEAVIARARDLLGAGERAFADALEELERRRDEARAQARDAEEQAHALRAQREALARRELFLKERAQELEVREAATFVDRLKRADKAIGQVVADLQRNPSHDAVRRARATVDALRGLVEAREEHGEAPDLVVGDRVRLRRLGQFGEVTAVSDGGVQVRAGALTLRVAPEDLERHDGPAPAPERKPRVKVAKAPRPPDGLDDAVRYPGNTVDLRGMRVDEAISAAEQFLDHAIRDRIGVVFVLHGHGTGALKQAIRQWLPTSAYIRKAKPANPEQGGDAFTVAALR